MEAWLRSWTLFRVKIFSAEISVRRFSVRRFSLRRFSLRSLHCGTFTANSHCGSPARKLSFSASIGGSVFHSPRDICGWILMQHFVHTAPIPRLAAMMELVGPCSLGSACLHFAAQGFSEVLDLLPITDTRGATSLLQTLKGNLPIKGTRGATSLLRTLEGQPPY